MGFSRRLLTLDGVPLCRDSRHAAEIGDRMPAEVGEKSQTEYFILPEVWRAEVCQGFDPQTVARLLAEHGCLGTEAGRLTVKPRLPGMGPSRCYQIKPELMALEV
ncbi:hypothetical protein [Ottowia sp.]|uniref:hypothetical protein n=1 Tax=Ottowia sp. TaxID=1898956 RepID=UPI00261D44EC|nr:hypothetical protein [Ottowia sp.]